MGQGPGSAIGTARSTGIDTEIQYVERGAIEGDLTKRGIGVVDGGH